MLSLHDRLPILLVKTDAGAVLIDGGMPQAADMLLAQMRELGVEPGDLKLIMHSQAHGDHVGPLAAVRRATGATPVSNRTEERRVGKECVSKCRSRRSP